MTVSQLILLVIISLLSSLIRQRISVPDLIREKWKNNVLYVSALISSASLIGLCFYNEFTLSFSKSIGKISKKGLIDNILFLIYVVSSYIYCLLSFSLFSRINEYNGNNSSSSVTVKLILIILMGMQTLSCI